MKKLTFLALTLLVLGLGSCKSKSDKVEQATELPESNMQKDIVQSLKDNIDNPDELKSAVGNVQKQVMDFVQKGDVDKLKDYITALQQGLNDNPQIQEVLANIQVGKTNLLNQLQSIVNTAQNSNFNVEQITQSLKDAGLSTENVKEAADKVMNKANEVSQEAAEKVGEEKQKAVDKAKEALQDKVEQGSNAAKDALKKL